MGIFTFPKRTSRPRHEDNLSLMLEEDPEAFTEGFDLPEPLPVAGLQGWSLPLALTGFIIAALIAMAFVQAPSVQVARGEVQPVAGLVEMRAPRAGRVREIRSDDDAPVLAGAPIFVLDTDQATDAGGTLANQELEHARRTQASLNEELRQRSRITASQMSELSSRIRVNQEELIRAREELTLQHDRSLLAQQTVEAGRKLHEQGLFSTLSLRQREEVVLELRQGQLAIETRISNAEMTLGVLKSQLERAVAEGAAGALELERRRSDEDERIVQLRASAEAVVVSPRAGRLATVRVRLGQTVSSGELLATVVPQGGPLQAEIWVPSTAIGRVKVGDQVRVLYDAFPYERFGLQHAVIEQIGGTPLPPELLPAGISIGEPMYKVIARLPRQHLMTAGVARPLQPGLRLEARIILEQRSVLAWLFAPLLKVFYQGSGG